jgi:hypothetical protein
MLGKTELIESSPTPERRAVKSPALLALVLVNLPSFMLYTPKLLRVVL